MAALSLYRLKPLCAAPALALAFTFSPAAHAHSASEELSLLSAVPVAVSVAAPVGVLASGATFVVVAVRTTAWGVEWILERASDGAQATLDLSAKGARAASLGVGTAVILVGMSAGIALKVGSEVVGFIPNELGKALLYNERLTP